MFCLQCHGNAYILIYTSYHCLLLLPIHIWDSLDATYQVGPQEVLLQVHHLLLRLNHPNPCLAVKVLIHQERLQVVLKLLNLLTQVVVLLALLQVYGQALLYALSI